MDKQIIHHMLESGGQVEEHYQGLEKSIFCNEGSQPFISFGNTDIIVASMNVHLREELFSFQFVEKIRNLEEWV